MKLKISNRVERLFSRQTSTKELRTELKANHAIAGRRLDDFTLSAMLTLAELKGELERYPTLSLFSVANYFSLDLLQSLVEQVTADRELKPLDFVASVGNAANYYLAREFSIHGSNLFAAASQLALTKGLLLAGLELSEGRAGAALVVRWQETERTRLCQVLLCEPVEDEKPADYTVAELEVKSFNTLPKGFVVSL